jgi:hypothetical protein
MLRPDKLSAGQPPAASCALGRRWRQRPLTAASAATRHLERGTCCVLPSREPRHREERGCGEWASRRTAPRGVAMLPRCRTSRGSSTRCAATASDLSSACARSNSRRAESTRGTEPREGLRVHGPPAVCESAAMLEAPRAARVDDALSVFCSVIALSLDCRQPRLIACAVAPLSFTRGPLQLLTLALKSR